MKKFIVFFVSFALLFNVYSFPVFASSGNDSGSDWATELQNGNAVVDFARGVIDFSSDIGTITFNSLINRYSLSPVCAVYDSTVGAIGAGMKYFIYLVKGGKSPQDAKTYMEGFINVSDGGSSLTGDGLVFAQNYYADGSQNGTGSSLSNLSYTYRYIPCYKNLNPVAFTSASVFKSAQKIMKDNPDYYFVIFSGRNWAQGYASPSYSMLAFKPELLGCVLGNTAWKNSTNECTFYTSDWSTNVFMNEGAFVAIRIYGYLENDTCTVSYLVDNSTEEVLYNGDGGNVNVDIDDILNPLVDQTGNFNTNGIFYTYSNPKFILEDYSNNHGIISTNSSTGYILTGKPNVESVVCYNTLVDLKKDTVSYKKTTTVLPSYTGNGINNSPISDSTVQQAEEIINNYYNDLNAPTGGGNNNNNNNGGGNNNDDDSSSSIWDTLLSSVKGFFELIGTLISGLLDSIGKIIPAITGLFDDLTDLANNGFTALLSAFFPFLPSEWFSVIGLAIGLVLFVWLVKLFKG